MKVTRGLKVNSPFPNRNFKMLSTISKFAAISAFALGVGAQQCAIGGDASIVALSGDSVGSEQVINGSRFLSRDFSRRCPSILTPACSQLLHQPASLIYTCAQHSRTLLD